MSHGRARARLGVAALALTLLAWAHPSPARSQDASAPDTAAVPAAVGHVNDFAGVMDDSSRAKLESFLAQVQEKTGAELAVLTVRSTEPESPSDYKVRVFERWKIGKKGEDNGLLMLVAVQQTEVRFETGYGLEGTLPDGLESRIYREVMRPYLKAGDFNGGITQGMLACAAKIAQEKNVTLEWDGSELRYDSGGGGNRLPIEPLILLLVAIIFLAIIRSRMRGGRGGWWWLGPGGFGGMGMGGWGGGGFGGGGGGGFGGFGGGSSGGGGGGGGGSGGW
ncbi:MAG TPA: TPM domain-containing protein [Candidatus Sulfotelmatobacter sp.]|nr:TPM domain-containing protein [Candidatus Sulfotelmatobacter sp.]